MSILNEFIASFPSDLIFENELMKNHASFRAGGAVRLMFIPDSIPRLIEAIGFCRSRDINYYIAGNCSNLLVRDCGFDGVLIKIGKDVSRISVSEDQDKVLISAQAGALLGELSALACDKGLTGLEFASGIPGTLGGAVYMNAGAYDSEMKNILVSADILDNTGNVITLTNSELGFGYRTSTAQKDGLIILSAVLGLKKGDKTAIQARIDELTALRAQKQPLELPSAGSAFKRPKGFYAGKLVSDAGLKGYKKGGAMVSDKHAGFIVNHDNATADDIIGLIEHIISTVQKNFGVELEPEIKIIP